MSKFYKSEQANPIGAYEIIVIDDDEGLNHLICKNLKREGYKCVQAFNGAQAVDAVKRKKNQILILDYKLPDFNGQEIIKLITEKQDSIPPFIVMTGFGDEKIAVEMMKLGAQQYIVKEGDFITILVEQLKMVTEDISHKKELKKIKSQLEASKQNFQVLFETMLEGVVYQNSRGEIISANSAAEQILGLKIDQMTGLNSIDPGWKAVDEDYNQLRRDKHPAMVSLKTGKRVENFLMGILNPQKNDYVWILINAVPQFKKGQSKPYQVYSTFTDITERKKAEKELKENQMRLELRKSIAEAFVLEEKDKIFYDVLHALLRHYNSKFGYFGYINQKGNLVCPSMTYDIWNECEVEEKSIVFPKNNWAGLWGESLKNRKSLIKNEKLKVPEGHVYLKNAMVGIIEFQGKLIGQLAFANNESNYTKSDLEELEEICQYISPLLNAELSEESHKTELIKAKEKAEENEKKLIEAQEIANVGSWEFDIEKNEVTWSKEAYRIFEFNFGEQLTYEGFTERIHPNDRKYHDDYTQKWIKEKRAESFEYRLLVPGGKLKYIVVSGKVICDENGNVTKLMGSMQDITRQKITELELIKAKEKAEESDRLKSAFLANMSHEIRTPMNGILGFTNLLEKSGLPAEQLQEYVDIIRKSGKRMLDTVNDLIDISRIETGQVEVELTDVNLKQEIRNLYLFFEAEARNKGLNFKINTSCNGEEFVLKSDRAKLNSIATNLIKNAIKYTKQGSIEIGCRSNNSSIELFVKDTGIGIPEKLQKQIFHRFVQVEQGYTRDYEGAGLGLSISKAYAEMLGGDIRVESEEGKGSVFYFSIPVMVESGQKNVAEITNNVQEEREVKLPENLTVLVAEDDEVSRYHLEVLLGKYCSKIYFAKTGIEAVKLCRSQTDINLVLMDIKMPDMDGYEAARQIRTFNKTVPIIAQTAYALSGDREKALEAGCNDYISKPINNKVLLHKIGKLKFN